MLRLSHSFRRGWRIAVSVDRWQENALRLALRRRKEVAVGNMIVQQRQRTAALFRHPRHSLRSRLAARGSFLSTSSSPSPIRSLQSATMSSYWSRRSQLGSLASGVCTQS